MSYKGISMSEINRINAKERSVSLKEYNKTIGNKNNISIKEINKAMKNNWGNNMEWLIYERNKKYNSLRITR